MRKYLAILGGFTASLVLLTAVPAKISGKNVSGQAPAVSTGATKAAESEASADAKTYAMLDITSGNGLQFCMNWGITCWVIQSTRQSASQRL